MEHRSHLATGPVAIVAAAPLIAVALAGIIATLPAPARADDDSSGITYVCRLAVAGENSNARMTRNSDSLLTCAPISIAVKMSNGSLHTIGHVTTKAPSGPDLSQALTPGQVNDAWVKYIESTFHVDHTS